MGLQGDLWAPHGEATTDNVQHETYNMQHKELQFNMNILISCLKCANKLHIAHFASPMAKSLMIFISYFKFLVLYFAFRLQSINSFCECQVKLRLQTLLDT